MEADKKSKSGWVPPTRGLYEPQIAPSALAPSEPAGPLPVVGSGGVVGLRDLMLAWVLYALTALLMFAVDMVGTETLAAAIYWPPAIIVVAWLLRKEPNK